MPIFLYFVKIPFAGSMKESHTAALIYNTVAWLSAVRHALPHTALNTGVLAALAVPLIVAVCRGTCQTAKELDPYVVCESGSLTRLFASRTGISTLTAAPNS